ncbi:hypothetical protein R1T08_25960 [Streptomyces sp. SBC-4]|nr:hypothetical protein [Streptomyces sp. SBC-4]MDV5147526.1 hypothetical protein [Streptomyces sp. SBC-4]
MAAKTAVDTSRDEYTTYVPSGPIANPDGPYAASPEGWWTRYGGAFDTRSGVVRIPPGPGTAALRTHPSPCRCGGR